MATGRQSGFGDALAGTNKNRKTRDGLGGMRRLAGLTMAQGAQ
jgi:hypothetical protein